MLITGGTAKVTPRFGKISGECGTNPFPVTRGAGGLQGCAKPMHGLMAETGAEFARCCAEI